jgi:hypothetical protein
MKTQARSGITIVAATLTSSVGSHWLDEIEEVVVVRSRPG